MLHYFVLYVFNIYVVTNKQSLCSSLLSLSATPSTPPPSLGTSLESLGGSGSLRLPLWDKASAEFCFARSRDLLTKNPFCMNAVLSNGKLCGDEETERVPKQEVPHYPEETEHDNDCYQDPHVICSNYGHLNQFQSLTNNVCSASVNKNVVRSQITKVKVKKIRNHVKALGSKTAYGECALKCPKYRRSSKSVDNPSAVSLICKQFKDSCGIRKLVSNSQNILNYSPSETVPNTNGSCLRTDVHCNSRRKYFSCANDILTEESSPFSSCSVSSDEDSDLCPVAFVNQQPFSHSDNRYAKLSIPFTDEAERVFSHQDLIDSSSSPPPITSFLNSLSPSFKDVTAPFSTYQHVVSLPSEKLTDARSNSPWPVELKASDAAVLCESPQPEVELCTSFNLTFSSACSSPDLAEYPELDGDFPGLPHSQ
jgi:hypothetical protein